MQNGVAVVAAGGNVEKSQFVGTLVVVAFGHVHGVARIAQADKIHAFHHAAVVHIEAGDNAFC